MRCPRPPPAAAITWPSGASGISSTARGRTPQGSRGAVSGGCCAISARVSRCRSRPHLRGIKPSPPQSSPSQRQAMEADMSDQTSPKSRREALRCMAFGGAGTLFALAGGVFTPVDLAVAATDRQRAARAGNPLFVQISDTHIGFNKEANPDVGGTLARSIGLVHAMREHPALIIPTRTLT